MMTSENPNLKQTIYPIKMTSNDPDFKNDHWILPIDPEMTLSINILTPDDLK